MEDIKSFVLLKYEIITSDRSTWPRLEKYPESVKIKWAWRCVADVEHLAKGHPAAEECIRVAKQYRDGLATKEELDKAWQAVPFGDTYAAYYAGGDEVVYAAFYASETTYIKCEEKWKLYIDWLIEELCEYEAKQ